MKKFFIVLFFIIVASLACVYIFIPANLAVSKVAVINCSPNAAYRIISSFTNDKKWWSNGNDQGSNSSHNNSLFVYNKDTFRITKRLHSSVDIQVTNKNDSQLTNLFILPVSVDSTAIQWQAKFTTGVNPYQRIQAYYKAVQLKKSLARIVDNMTPFLEDKRKVYGISIDKTSTTDTLLVATKAVLAPYPTTDQIYKLIEKLQQHLYENGAQQTGSPMVNITPYDSNYELMVALPTNLKINNKDDIFFKRMIPGNFLVTEVKGGDYKINQARNALKIYLDDYKKMAMAIPFQSLISDRRREPDSTNWITKVYYPVAR
jgi:hypothetical protein